MAKAGEVDGIKQLFKKLDQLEPKMARKPLRTGTRKGARLVLEVARALAPVDEGDLEASLRVRAGKRRRGRIEHNAIAGAEQGAGDPYYAGFVNFGTRFQEADWYMTQAFQTTWPAAEQEVVKEIIAFLKTQGRGSP